MKHMYRISGSAPGSPLRLFAATVLAFIVMVFINGFIGSMGGFPAFIAFAVVFYLLRTVVSAENRIGHQLAMTSRRELFYLFVDYAAAYLFLWAILRLGLMFSRVTGWGNFNGASAMEYVRELLDTSMLEKWAYFFVGVLMFAFIVSLFPLVVIRRPSAWAAYAFLDGAGFALLSELIGTVSRLSIGKPAFVRGMSLIDDLLLCGGLAEWKKALCLGGILVLAALVGCFAFFFAVRCYAPAPGRTQADTLRWRPGESKSNVWDVSVLGRNLVLAGIGILLFFGGTAVAWFGAKEPEQQYEKVAEYLTGDAVLAPMVCDGQIYIPTDEVLTLDESGTPLGYLAHKGESCDSRLYELTVANVLYAGSDGGNGHMQMSGANTASFAPAKELEETEAWRSDSVFLLWDEDWVRESAFSHEPTGYTVCSRELVDALERQFGQVSYRVSDFEEYDAYFTLCGYADREQALTDELTPGHWVGCIFVKNNTFYYGNMDNPIAGVLLQELLDILGGY